MRRDAPRFAIMGSGGVGGYFGARLARAGLETVFIARGAHLEAIRSAGLRIEGEGETFTVEATVTDDPAAVGPVDFVLFAVKLWDTEEAANACKPIIAPDTAVLSLQNGVDAEPILSDILGKQHVLGAIAEISATIAAPGVIARESPFARIRFGELGANASARAERLANAFDAAGIDHEHVADIAATIWSKFIFLVGLSALTALTRRPIGEVRADADTRTLLQRIMEEAYAVAVASEIALPPDIVARLMRFIDDLPPGVRASMAVDLERGHRLELPWLSGAVVRIGARHEVPTPANAFVCAALKLHAKA